MDKLNKNEKQLTSIDQLIPNPDVYGITQRIKDSPQKEKIVNLLRIIKPGCLFVTYIERKDVIPNMSFFADGAHRPEGGLFKTANIPNVKICLNENVASPIKRISPEEEKLIVDFLDELGYEEVTVKPQNAEDEIENRLFSLTTGTRATRTEKGI